MQTTIDLLQNWYKQQCNSHWEHTEGISISTLDNPGWRMSVGLSHTKWAGRLTERVDDFRTDLDWIQWSVRGNLYDAAGGPGNLNEIVSVFQNWVSASSVVKAGTTKLEQPLGDFRADAGQLLSGFSWLQSWYVALCDGDWEHSYGVGITSLHHVPGWFFWADLADTVGEGFEERSDLPAGGGHDWMEWRVIPDRFLAVGGAGRLDSMIGLFEEWFGRKTALYGNAQR